LALLGPVHTTTSVVVLIKQNYFFDVFVRILENEVKIFDCLAKRKDV